MRTVWHIRLIWLLPLSETLSRGTNLDVAQPGRALALGARGRKFKSCHPDHLIICGHTLELSRDEAEADGALVIRLG